jgi:hypothetical protein
MADFQGGDIVALKHDDPYLKMTAGNQGVIVFDLGEGLIYEVNFLGERGFWGNIWEASELVKLDGEPLPIVAEHAEEITKWLAEMDG